MNSAALPQSALLALLFAAGMVCGGLVVCLFRPRPRCACRPLPGVVVSAARDEEGWVLLGADGEILPWPDDWPDEEVCDHDMDELALFLFARGWQKVNLGTDEQPREGWLRP